MLHPAPGSPCYSQVTLAVHPRQELLSYIPKPLQGQVNTASIKSLVTQELRQMQGFNEQKAQIGFIGRAAKGPLPGRVKARRARVKVGG